PAAACPTGFDDPATFGAPAVPAVAGATVRWEALRPLANLCLLSLPTALVVFLIIPRTYQPFTTNASAAMGSLKRTTVGFSPSVSLDEMGEVLQSEAVVFDVWPTDRKGKPVSIRDDVLWRGMVFTGYSSGKWRHSPDRVVHAIKHWVEPRELSDNQVQLRIEQRLATPNVMFSLRPLYWAGLPDESPLHYIQMESRLVMLGQRKEGDQAPLAYRIVTDFQRGSYRDPEEMAPSLAYRQLALELPADLVRLRALAADWTKDLNPDDRQGKIERIMQRLTYGGGYGYSLDIRPVDRNLDPVEDFLLNRKEGHCEYFATALALLLRSVDVPCRLVNGFKGVDYNAAGGYYQVRELLAHSWVEAYNAEDRYWMTLDPTPGAAREEGLSSRRSGLQPVRELLDAGNRLWTGYVVGYSNTNQRQLASTLFSRVFGSIQGRLAGVYYALEETVVHLWTFGLTLDTPNLAPLLIFSFFFVLAIATRRWWYRLVRKGLRRLRRLSDEPADHQRPTRVVAWPAYRRWIKHLKKLGWRRAVTETPLEFAASIADRLAADPAAAAWAPLPGRLAAAYYDRRYGPAETAIEPTTDTDWKSQVDRFFADPAARRALRKTFIDPDASLA
ncbi:MAG: transglutaminaseTgpA domain-containing protein, partial [Planctomycetia bacterium]